MCLDQNLKLHRVRNAILLQWKDQCQIIVEELGLSAYQVYKSIPQLSRSDECDIYIDNYEDINFADMVNGSRPN